MLKICLLFVLAPLAVGAEIKVYSKQIELKEDSKKLAQEKAVQEISRVLFEEILEDNKSKKENSKIWNSLLKNKNRYILSVSSSSGKVIENGKFTFTVKVTASKKNLKDLLKTHGFFKDSHKMQCILPLFYISYDFNQEKKHWFWWDKENLNSSSDLQKIAEDFFSALGEQTSKINFFFLNPIFHKLTKVIPPSLLPAKEKKKKFKDIISLSQFFSCDIILSGFIHIGEALGDPSFSSFNAKTDLRTPYGTKFFIRMFHVKTRENLISFKRQFPFPKNSKTNPLKEVSLKSKDVIESLMSQFSLYLENKSLNLNHVIVSLQGSLKYAEKEKLMKRLIEQIEGLESFQVMYLSSSNSIYKLALSKKLSEVEKELKKISLKKFLLRIRKINSQKLKIYVKNKA
ncbi:MAG: hypothetical protein GDA46_06480 [Bdellovibrionales bacterium]|nr:hypothetical protein [Bdellovibrionales bacterium]